MSGVPEAYQPVPEAYQPIPEAYQPVPEAYQPIPEAYQPVGTQPVAVVEPVGTQPVAVVEPVGTQPVAVAATVKTQLVDMPELGLGQLAREVWPADATDQLKILAHVQELFNLNRDRLQNTVSHIVGVRVRIPVLE